jgi:hypothetical protein
MTDLLSSFSFSYNARSSGSKSIACSFDRQQGNSMIGLPSNKLYFVRRSKTPCMRSMRVSSTPTCRVHRRIEILTRAYLQDPLQFLVSLFRILFYDISYVALEDSLPIKWAPLEKAEVAVEVADTVLYRRAAQEPPTKNVSSSSCN